MSTSIMKVFLVLAVVACICQAQTNESGQQCLCTRVRKFNGSDIKDIQIYPATVFCSKVEIVVTNNSGYRYCLNPKLRAVQKLVAAIMTKQRASEATPVELSSTTGSSTTPRI